mmetsp:Transcript_61185/g.120017  ORF Transcript_61185/g.120017 Transcript_61185/m.120017 type:complete len:215 (-) Transcript_61185:338-982(-)
MVWFTAAIGSAPASISFFTHGSSRQLLTTDSEPAVPPLLPLPLPPFVGLLSAWLLPCSNWLSSTSTTLSSTLCLDDARFRISPSKKRCTAACRGCRATDLALGPPSAEAASISPSNANPSSSKSRLPPPLPLKPKLQAAPPPWLLLPSTSSVDEELGLCALGGCRNEAWRIFRRDAARPLPPFPAVFLRPSVLSSKAVRTTTRSFSFSASTSSL